MKLKKVTKRIDALSNKIGRLEDKKRTCLSSPPTFKGTAISAAVGAVTGPVAYYTVTNIVLANEWLHQVPNFSVGTLVLTGIAGGIGANVAYRFKKADKPRKLDVKIRTLKKEKNNLKTEQLLANSK